MPYQQTPYTGISLAAGVGLLALTAYLLDRYRSGGVPPVVWALAAITGLSGVWSIATGAGLASVSLDAKLFWATASFAGLLVPPTWVVFALLYTDRDHWVTTWSVAVLYAPPVAVVAAAAAFGPQGVVFASVDRVHNGSFYVLVSTNTAWFQPVIAYLYLLLLAGMAVLYQWLYRAGGVYRGQAAALIAGSLAPTVANLLLFTDLVPRGVNVTPFGFVVTSVAFTYALVRYSLLDVVPVGRASVIETMRDGYLVLDGDGRVVDANPAARAASVVENPVGRPIEAVLPECPPLDDAALGDEPTTLASIERDTDDGGRHIDVRPSRLADGDGVLLLLQDVTQQRERERELRRANEQLEQFASVVSHDLRNPLNIAQGRLRLVAEDCESDHVDAVGDALDRMETLVDHTLRLARLGQTAGDLEPVDLDAAAREAWRTVATADATLVADAPPAVRADPDRLRQLFENLFRNAVEHAGADATVRVGGLDDGFYVEDDGPGIPEGDRDAVLEFGYSTTEAGTGFGLAIVAQVANAHGWDVTVTEGADGGARFEFTGVEPATDPAPGQPEAESAT